MAEGGSRQNKVYKAMNRPLTILGAERRHCTDKRHCAQREGTGDAVELSQLDLRISDSRVWISVRG